MELLTLPELVQSRSRHADRRITRDHTPSNWIRHSLHRRLRIGTLFCQEAEARRLTYLRPAPTSRSPSSLPRANNLIDLPVADLDQLANEAPLTTAKHN